MHRVYDVSPQGMLLRRKHELEALNTVGRSKQRAVAEMRKRKHDTELNFEREWHAKEMRDIQSAKNLADRVKADLAARAAKYQLEVDAENLRKHEAHEALLAEQALIEADRARAMEGVEACSMADEDPRAIQNALDAEEKAQKAKDAAAEKDRKAAAKEKIEGGPRGGAPKPKKKKPAGGFASLGKKVNEKLILDNDV